MLVSARTPAGKLRTLGRIFKEKAKEKRAGGFFTAVKTFTSLVLTWREGIFIEITFLH